MERFALASPSVADHIKKVGEQVIESKDLGIRHFEVRGWDVFVDRRVPDNCICFYRENGSYIGTIKIDK